LILALILCALTCNQCFGWQGRGYSPRSVQASECDNFNNQCRSQQFCVKKIDPIKSSKRYETFNSDCWQSTTIRISRSNVSTIINGYCYPYEDSSNPPKRWTYCFCNDRDYCNGVITVTLLLSYLWRFQPDIL
uniref:Protein sleepless n=1 Tax=Syphacia muris TaxID=451379 RepID=A0A0N5ATZ8_9BILA